VASNARPSSPGRGEQTRRTILDAAIARFARDGYRSTSVADIARDASIGGTVAYSYFPSKEALFIAAVDEDAAAVISAGLSNLEDEPGTADWPLQLILDLFAAVERHPLARRLLAGLEPDVTSRVLDISAVGELRKACIERLRNDQLAGDVSADVDPTVLGNGIVAISLSLLMSMVQIGAGAADAYGYDVAAVFAAALAPPR
jgi:AcrR family transcriptional regulator